MKCPRLPTKVGPLSTHLMLCPQHHATTPLNGKHIFFPIEGVQFCHFKQNIPECDIFKLALYYQFASSGVLQFLHDRTVKQCERLLLIKQIYNPFVFSFYVSFFGIVLSWGRLGNSVS